MVKLCATYAPATSLLKFYETSVGNCKAQIVGKTRVRNALALSVSPRVRQLLRTVGKPCLRQNRPCRGSNAVLHGVILDEETLAVDLCVKRKHEYEYWAWSQCEQRANLNILSPPRELVCLQHRLESWQFFHLWMPVPRWWPDFTWPGVLTFGPSRSKFAHKTCYWVLGRCRFFRYPGINRWEAKSTPNLSPVRVLIKIEIHWHDNDASAETLVENVLMTS